MITLAYKTGRHEDVGLGYDLSTNQLMLWVESGTFRPVQRRSILWVHSRTGQLARTINTLITPKIATRNST